MTKEFRVSLSIELPDSWDEDRLMDFLLSRISYEGGAMGGSIIPEPLTELEFYDNLRIGLAEVIAQFLDKNEDIPYMSDLELSFHSLILAQRLVDSLTKDAII